MTNPGATLAIVGTTASGKTGLSLALADALGAAGVRLEVVNADAMARYRGMDIGTAKVTEAERRRVPHHQLDVLDPREEASVRTYQSDARRDAAEVRQRGAVPVYVGGSGLYVRAALDELDIPPTDGGVRDKYAARAQRIGAEALHAELAEVDPKAAESIAPANVRRVVRALEVIELTGRPFSATRPPGIHHLPTLQLGVRVAPEVLDERIRSRAKQMLSDGLVEEAVAVRAAGWGRTAATAVGYPQALALADGAATWEETVDAIALATRRLAKRQRTWFRSDPRTLWLDLGEATSSDLAKALAETREQSMRFFDGAL